MDIIRKSFIVLLVLSFVFFFACSKSGETQKAQESAKASEPVKSEPAKTESAAPQAATQTAPQAEASTASGASKKVGVQLFVMSYCPYGIQAENSMIKTLKALKGYVDFELHFVVSAAGGAIQSLHGQKEVDMDAVQICVGKINPDAQMEFIVEWNKNTSQPWQDVASKLSIDPDEIKGCLNSGYGVDVLKKDGSLCEELGVQGSPTLVIDGQQYRGPRSSRNFFDAICQAFEKKGAKPPVCSAPPDYLSTSDGQAAPGSCGDQGKPQVDEKPYNLIIVYPEDAMWPVEAQLKGLLEQTFPKAKIERVSDKSPRGKDLLKKTGVNRLPAVISTSAEFANNEFAKKKIMNVESKGGLIFINPADFGANFFVGLKPTEGVFEVYYRPDSARVKGIMPEILNIFIQNNYKAKKTKFFVKPYLKVSNDKLSAEGGDKALDEAKRELVVAGNWMDSLPSYLQALAGDYANWEMAAQKAGITAAVLLEKSRSGDTESQLLANSKQFSQFGIDQRADLLFVYRGQEMVLVRNAEEFGQFVKRLP